MKHAAEQRELRVTLNQIKHKTGGLRAKPAGFAWMGDAGFEPDSITSLQDNALRQSKNPGGVESDAPGNLTLISDPRLSALVAVWDRLPGNVQAGILLLAHEAIHPVGTLQD